MANREIHIDDAVTRTITCPRCERPAGKTCRSPKGGYTKYPHRERVDAYRVSQAQSNTNATPAR